MSRAVCGLLVIVVACGDNQLRSIDGAIVDDAAVVDDAIVIDALVQCATAADLGASCNDHQPCTRDDVCDENGQCAGTAFAGCCASNAQCDDQNDCTTDNCDETGTCHWTPLPDGTSCDDDAACSHSDTCTGGHCSGATFSCDDRLACTTDACVDPATSAQCTNAIQAGNCLIDGACYADGEVSPTEFCLACNPTWNTWLLVANTCYVSGTCLADGDPLPGLTCLACDGATSNYNIVADTCYIYGQCYAAGDTDPGNPCLVCDPTKNTSGWTLEANTCFVGGECRASGADPTNTCHACNPTQSPYAWIPVANPTCVVTYAGDGFVGSNDGPYLTARFRAPKDIERDPVSGALYVADSPGIRKLLNGQVTTVPGTGTINATGLEFGANGLLYIAAGNVIYTWNGTTLVTLYSFGSGMANGAAATAQFRTVFDVLRLADGTLLVTDRGNNCVRRISTTGDVSTEAGVCQASGCTDGQKAGALFSGPEYITRTVDGSILVSDATNQRQRWFSLGVGPVSGCTVTNHFPGGRGRDDNVWAAVGIGLHRIIYGTGPGNGTVAGWEAGYVDGDRDESRFLNPTGVVFAANGDLFVTDTGNRRIRRILAP